MLLGYSALWYNSGKEKINQDGNKLDGQNALNLYFRSGGGIFLLPSLVAGLALNWQYELYKYTSGIDGMTEKNSTNTLSFGPFLRYYFWQWNALLFYTEALFAMGVYNQVFKSTGTTKVLEGLLTAHLLVGLSFFITRQLALDVGMGYLWTRYKNNDSNTISSYNQFMACVGLVFFIGQNSGLLNFQNYK